MILITGANGFLGSTLVRHFSLQNIAVKATFRSTLPDALQNLPYVTWLQCDLLDVDVLHETMHGVTQVYHCANMVSFDAADAENLMHNNVESTANVVNACLENNIEKLLYVSSVGAIARESEGKLISEKTPWLQSDSTSVYALSKYKAEMEVWRGSAEGLPVVVICPSIILGEGNYNLGSSAIFKTGFQQFPFYTSGVNGFVDVQDVVKAMQMLMQSTIINERFIINADNYSYKYIFTTIANALGVKAPNIKAGSFLSGLAWRFFSLKKLFTGKKNILTRETAHTAQSVYAYDNSKFLHAFPDFAYYQMPETIARIAKDFLKNKLT